MLAYILGLVVGTSSLLILVKAVLAKDLQKEANLFQTDIFWSGVGLFYGLALWVCAERITGALLLGQIASVCLIGWLVVQVQEMRLAADGISRAPNSNFITDMFRKPATELTLTEVAEELEETVEESEIIEAEIESPTEETQESQVEAEELEETLEVSASEEDIPSEMEAMEMEAMEMEEEQNEEIAPEAEITTTAEEVTPEANNEIEEGNSAVEENIEENIDTEIEVPTTVLEPVAKQEPEVKAKDDDLGENKIKEAEEEN